MAGKPALTLGAGLSIIQLERALPVDGWPLHIIEVIAELWGQGRLLLFYGQKEANDTDDHHTKLEQLRVCRVVHEHHPLSLEGAEVPSVLEGLTAYRILATPFSKYHTSTRNARSICKKACTLVRALLYWPCQYPGSFMTLHSIRVSESLGPRSPWTLFVWPHGWKNSAYTVSGPCGKLYLYSRAK